MTDCCPEKAEARRHGMFEGPVGDDWFNCKCKGKTMVTVQKSRTFSLTQEDVLAVVAEYLNQTQSLNIAPEDLKLSIADSRRDGYHDETFVPARINNISVTVDESN